jgi:hypothetical protein
MESCDQGYLHRHRTLARRGLQGLMRNGIRGSDLAGKYFGIAGGRALERTCACVLLSQRNKRGLLQTHVRAAKAMLHEPE